MPSKAFVSATLLALAAATAATEPASECTTRPVQCCISTTSTVTTTIFRLMGFLKLDTNIANIALPIGLTCDPITVVGAGSGATCSAEPVCCENNGHNGVIAFGCVPVNLHL